MDKPTAQSRRSTLLLQPRAWWFAAALLLNPYLIAYVATEDGRIDPPTRYSLAWLAWFAAVAGLYLLLFRHEALSRNVRHRWKSYLLLAASIFLALCLVELSAVWLGDRLKPREFHVENYEFAFDVRLNSQGFRDTEFSPEKPPGVRRILFLGDSFVYGVGVEEEHCIPNLLEATLNRRSESRFEVFNLGIPGANPTGYADVARRFSKYNPDLVLLGFYIDNDVSLGRTGPVGIRRFALWRLFERLSHRLFAAADFAWARGYDIDPFYREKAVHGEINPLLLVRASSFEDEQAYYDHVRERFESNPKIGQKLLEVRNTFPGVPFVVVLFPSKYQTSPEAIPELEKIGFHFRAGCVAGDGIQRSLGRFFDENDVAHLDLLPVIREVQERSGRSPYFTIDDHFNELGYQAAAEVIAKRVVGLLKNGEE